MNIIKEKIAAGLRAIQPKTPLFFLTTAECLPDTEKEVFGFKVYEVPVEYMDGFRCSRNASYFEYLPVFDNDDFDVIEDFLQAAIEHE